MRVSLHRASAGSNSMTQWMMEGVSMTTEVLSHENGNGFKPNWAAIQGIRDTSDGQQVFQGGAVNGRAIAELFPIGLAISDATMENGECEVRIRFSAPFTGPEQAAGVVLGYRSRERRYVFARLGAAHSSYSIGEYANGSWMPLVTAGQRQNLKHDREYLLHLRIKGQELIMHVDGVPVSQCVLSQPLEGRQVGLIAAGDHEITFSRFEVAKAKPKAFVVMQFAEPYDTFCREVIQKQAEAAGFEVFRIDERAGPGVILQDIQGVIEQSAVVIAEITLANPNVFCEVGYAHALAKPTILLTKKGSELPFDIRSFGVVFYHDTIGGKAEVEQSLHSHLMAVARG